MTEYRLSPLAEQDIETILGRVLHDGMDLTRHLPVEYRAADRDEGGLG